MFRFCLNHTLPTSDHYWRIVLILWSPYTDTDTDTNTDLFLEKIEHEQIKSSVHVFDKAIQVKRANFWFKKKFDMIILNITR